MEWGSVAEWVGAVGTIGVLLLGIVLFAQDRAIARRAGVDALNTWLSWEDVTTLDEGFRYPDQRGGYASGTVSNDERPAKLPHRGRR